MNHTSSIYRIGQLIRHDWITFRWLQLAMLICATLTVLSIPYFDGKGVLLIQVAMLILFCIYWHKVFRQYRLGFTLRPASAGEKLFALLPTWAILCVLMAVFVPEGENVRTFVCKSILFVSFLLAFLSATNKNRWIICLVMIAFILLTYWYFHNNYLHIMYQHGMDLINYKLDASFRIALPHLLSVQYTVSDETHNPIVLSSIVLDLAKLLLAAVWLKVTHNNIKNYQIK